MFTIKHITLHKSSAINVPSYNVEKLYEAAEVVFCTEEHEMGYLQLRSGETFIAGLSGGMAYVMNDHGKTVARYDLPTVHFDETVPPKAA